MSLNEKAENVEMMEPREVGNSASGKWSALVFFACILSIGSLAYTTWSFLDLNRIDAVKVERLGGVSLIGLSAAAAMDIFWTATMVAEYRGRKIMAPFGRKRHKDGPKERINVLPYIGWIEVLAIAGMLGYHGANKSGLAAAFTAILPIATKFVWMLALDDIRDPAELTEDEKATVAQELRAARLAKARSSASVEKHEADMEEMRRKNEADLEEAKAKAQRRKVELEAKFELERAELEGAAEVEMMRDRTKADIQIERFRGRNKVEMERLDAEQAFRMQAPVGYNLIQGEIARPQQQPQLTGDSDSEVTILGEGREALARLTEPERRKVDLAARYYAADHNEGGVTKAAFSKANDMHPPRVTEATREFPVEWFVENKLAVWMQ